jgi:hypothetical protein
MVNLLRQITAIQFEGSSVIFGKGKISKRHTSGKVPNGCAPWSLHLKTGWVSGKRLATIMMAMCGEKSVFGKGAE